jgi:L,D-peptidoglycan transpeptidase YkuD (ErfK/YbiS/YcfS/YnhG family)
MTTMTAMERGSFFKAAMMRKRIRASKRAVGCIVLILVHCARSFAAELDGVKQMVVSIAPTWDSTTGKLQLFERQKEGWVPVGSPWSVLYGKNGLVWGRGVLGTEEPGMHKQERDGRAPCGVFRIGTIYTYDAALPAGARYPFRTVGLGDAWIDDVTSPDYNKHVVVNPDNPPAWFEKQKMRHGDFAYRWLVEIRHNSDPPVAGAGSAIFFHIRRGPARPSAGCTTMAEENLVQLIKWLRADQRPHYALLTRAEYLAKWKTWGLPSPQEAAALLPAK